MKISLKSVVAIALTGAAALGAVNASADVVVPSSGNGELTLFVRDTVTGNVYARGLGVTLNDFASEAVTGGAYSGPTNVGYSLPTIAHDANMSSFLGQTAGHDVVWAVMGGDTVGSNLAANPRRLALTSQTDLAANPLAAPSNTTLGLAINGFGGLVDQINANLADQSGSSVFGLNESGGIYGNGTSGEPATHGFDTGLDPSTLIGAEQFFYMVTSSNVSGSQTGGGGNPGRVFMALNLQLDANGDLHAVGAPTAPVPLPAAVWLLGSGLVGLAGIRRRRAAAVAV